VALGAAGVVLPLLPATPFFLLAAGSFARTSPRFHRWLTEHQFFGRIIRAYRERRGLTSREKALTLIALWVSLGVSALLVSRPFPRIVLATVAVGVTLHILRIPAPPRQRSCECLSTLDTRT
jgi:uncharacterized membrane protein YbaN (DUF454 family)